MPDWIVIKEIENATQYKNLLKTLDKGEASAITLALELQNSQLIIDEKKGRRIAKSLHISIIGSLKIIILAKEKGLIKSPRGVVKKFQEIGFYISDRIVSEVYRLTEEE